MNIQEINYLNEVVEKQKQLVALQARMEGMKAENEMRRVRGESPAYSEDSFFCLEQEILGIR